MAIRKILKRIYHLLPPGRVEKCQGQGDVQGEMGLDSAVLKGRELRGGGSFLLSE